MGNGVKDNVQVYNIPKFDGYHSRNQPQVVTDNIKEVESFSRVRALRGNSVSRTDCAD